MAESESLPSENDEQSVPDAQFHIRRIYAKDISFETPNSPAVFNSEWQPETDLNLRTQATQLAAGEYEVILSVTATVKVGDNVAYLVEVQQAGIFGIVGMTSAEAAPVLGAYCPSVLYPYAREMVSDLVIRGGFPPFILSPVNFEALFAQQQAENDAPAPSTD
jgi:preprotein translocase subunit SecB